MNVPFSHSSDLCPQKDGRKVRSRWEGTFTFPPTPLRPSVRPPSPLTASAHSLRPLRSLLRRDRSSSKVGDAECLRVGGASTRWRRDHSPRRYRRLTTGQDFRLCAARLAAASRDRGRRFRGGAESCTWESRASMRQDRLFPGISGFLYRRQDRLSCSHVRRPPNAHMGTRQLVLPESEEPQNHAENRRPPRRSPLLPCAVLPQAFSKLFRRRGRGASQRQRTFIA